MATTKFFLQSVIAGVANVEDNNFGEGYSLSEAKELLNDTVHEFCDMYGDIEYCDDMYEGESWYKGEGFYMEQELVYSYGDTTFKYNDKVYSIENM